MNITETTRRYHPRTELLRQLVAAAHARCATAPMNSDEREFYLGVAAAADDLLHPERAAARPSGWLVRESPTFRDGFLRASTLASTVMTVDRMVTSLPLPPYEPVD